MLICLCTYIWMCWGVGVVVFFCVSICIEYVYGTVWVSTGVWRSEDHFVELALSFYLYVGLKHEIQLAQACLTSPFTQRQSLACFYLPRKGYSNIRPSRCNICP